MGKEVKIFRNREINPTQQSVNGKLQQAIMWTQIAEILERCGRSKMSFHLREEIDSIEALDLIGMSDQRKYGRQIFISEMNI